jgi:hypothetical protein
MPMKNLGKPKHNIRPVRKITELQNLLRNINLSDGNKFASAHLTVMKCHI